MHTRMWYWSTVCALVLVVTVRGWTGNEAVVPVTESHVVLIGAWAVDTLQGTMTATQGQVETSVIKSATHRPFNGGDVYRITQVVSFSNGSSLILHTASQHPTLGLDDAVMQRLRILEPTHAATGYGSSKWTDTASKSIERIRKFVLRHIREGIPPYAVVTVLRAQQQMVQGILYKLDIEMRELNKRSRIVHVEVLQSLSGTLNIVLERTALE